MPPNGRTHADGVGAPVEPGEEPGRAWRVRFGRFALAERDSSAQTVQTERSLTVRLESLSAELSPADFVEATVVRLPAAHPIDPRPRGALRCLAWAREQGTLVP